MDFEEAKIEPEVEETDVLSLPKDKKDIRPGISKLREWFINAVDNAQDWREEAREDFDFVSGKQWTDAEKQDFIRKGKPPITINRIKPLINVLSGYQRLNRYDIDFLPRTSDDIDICKVRRGVTKYVMDACDYSTQESLVFMDSAICGIGWFETGYKMDLEIGDGEAFIHRQDPFGMYVDPEARKHDFSDAKYICRAKWVDKDELITIYPEKEQQILMQCAIYDKAERRTENEREPIWNQRELKKIRLVECWYKVKEKTTMFYLTDGTAIPKEKISVDMFLNGLITGEKTISIENVRVAAFFDNVLLEDIESPYEHRHFPFVPLVCYHYGTTDLPAGFVRDLKDPQREINKRRIQTLHILNTSGNGGGFIEAGAMTPQQKADFNKHGNDPGHYSEVQPNGLSKIRERVMQVPTGSMQGELEATNDLKAISGINESLMGTEVPSESSGRAIELRQKQAVTHIAPMFDNLRSAKKKIAILLWGTRGHKGIIPQYYTDDKVYRVEAENGQQFIRVNQQVDTQDQYGNLIHKVLNDLSVGEFDIVIADTEASTTQRQAQMWGLVDAVSKLGVPGDLVFDIILDLSDLPNKNEIKERYQQRQQAQSQQAQQQIQLEMIKNQNQHQSIAFKDAPFPIQLAMAAKQGLIDPKIAEYATNIMVQQLFPQLANVMVQQQQLQNMQQLNPVINQQAMPAEQTQPQQSKPMTEAAERSLMNDITPAM